MQLRLLSAFALALTTTACKTSPGGAATPEVRDVDALVRAFNAGRDRTRVVMLAAPT